MWSNAIVCLYSLVKPRASKIIEFILQTSFTLNIIISNHKEFLKYER